MEPSDRPKFGHELVELLLPFFRHQHDLTEKQIDRRLKPLEQRIAELERRLAELERSPNLDDRGKTT